MKTFRLEVRAGPLLLDSGRVEDKDWPVGALIVVPRDDDRSRFEVWFQYAPDWIAQYHAHQGRGTRNRFFAVDTAPVDDDVRQLVGDLGFLHDVLPDECGSMWPRFRDAVVDWHHPYHSLGLDESRAEIKSRVLKALDNSPAFFRVLASFPEIVRLGALTFVDPNTGRAIAVGPQVPAARAELRSALNEIPRLLAGKREAAQLCLPAALPGYAYCVKFSLYNKYGSLVSCLTPWDVLGYTSNDNYWVALCLRIAERAGIETALEDTLTVYDGAPVLTFRRWDRAGEARLPYMSAMTATGRGFNAIQSYFAFADAIQRYSADPQADLEQLYMRAVLNCLLRLGDPAAANGLVWTPFRGYRLTPMWRAAPPGEFRLQSEPRAVVGYVRPYEPRDLSLYGARRPTLDDLIQAGPEFGLKRSWERLLGQVADAVYRWQVVAEALRIPGDEDYPEIARVLSRPEVEAAWLEFTPEKERQQRKGKGGRPRGRPRVPRRRAPPRRRQRRWR